MPSRRTSAVHQAAVSRRLAELADQLADARAPAVDAAAGTSPAVEEVELAPAAGGEWWSSHTHVAEAPAPLVLVPEIGSEPVPAREPRPARRPEPVPMPGRHASHRRIAAGEVLTGLMPEILRGRVRLGPGQLAVVAVVVALGLAVTAWWAVRGHPAQPVPAAVPAPALVPGSAPDVGAASAVAGPPASAAPDSGPPSGAARRLTVDVAGKVRRPGIVVLDEGARVVDAVQRAGGARAGVDLTSLNLARPLVDGEQILVGVGPATSSASSPGAAPAAVPGATPGVTLGALVDLNLASETELETLPDVGPVTAGSIIAWRDAHGAFTSVSELLEVDGIGEVTLAKLTPLVTV